MMESHSKVCNKCKEEKPRKEFSKDRRAKDGLQSRCKACRKQNYQENREKELECNKQWYQENREKKLEYSKQYYQENREERLEYDKQYYQENREKMLEGMKQWYQENPEKASARNAKRRALKQDGIPEALKDCPIERERLVQTYKLRDLFTKATGVEHHVDHIWPLSKGGPHWSGNLQVITAKENLSKHASFCEDTARVIQESLDEHISNRQ
jgi:5-methylcytosine-specific restriction endonuclease McrA